MKKKLSREGFCRIKNCERPIKCRRLCNMHYARKRTKAATVNPCGCGCGGLTPYRYVWGHHTRLFSSEEQSRRGRQNNGDYKRDTGSADWYRKVRGRHEHRVVMEKIVGRPLSFTDVVHHIDENKKNNHPNNLLLMSRRDHMWLHIHR